MPAESDPISYIAARCFDAILERVEDLSFFNLVGPRTTRRGASSPDLNPIALCFANQRFGSVYASRLWPTHTQVRLSRKLQNCLKFKLPSLSPFSMIDRDNHISEVHVCDCSKFFP